MTKIRTSFAAGRGRRKSIVLLLALIVGLIAVPSAAAAKVPPAPVTAATLNTAFNAYGNAGNHWTGADGTASVALPDGRIAWIFADTFLGTVNADFSRPPFSPMVNNSIVVQTGSQLTATLHGGTSSEPKALVTPTQSGEFYWPADGIVEGDKMKVVYNRHRRTGDGSLDFILTGSALATFSLPALTLDSVTELDVGSTVSWGSEILVDGGFTYVYGTSSAPGRMKFAHVARAAGGALGGPWQYWTGATWTSDQSMAGRLLSGVGTGYSVQKVGSQYVLVTHENNLLFDPQLVAYTASSPTGPFTGPAYLYTAPEVRAGGKTIVYDARLHPELAPSGKLLLSYNVNSLDFADQMADARLYRPRFVEIAWPLPVGTGTPVAPAGLTVSAQDDAAQLSWSAVPGATSYRVHQRDVTGGQSHFARQPAVVTGTQHRVSLLIPGHRYEFKVTAGNAAGEGAFSAVSTATPQSTKPVAEAIRFANRPDSVPGYYIVALRPQSAEPERVKAFAEQLLAQAGGALDQVYPRTLRGFAAMLTETQARNLAAHPDVLEVEQDLKIELDGAGARRDVQQNPPWNLDRIDQRDPIPDGLYRSPNNGAGVTAYVVDSGIAPHSAFGNRIQPGFNAIAGETDSDCFGHGTHVAGTLGGAGFGVAPGVQLVPVKIFGCLGNSTNRGAISGVEWVAANAKTPAVVNMSLKFTTTGGDASHMTTAVESLVGDGITVVASAGNAGGDACGQLPARLESVITVGATQQGAPPDYTDARWSTGSQGGSNFGDCVDIWAPGAGIVSASHSDVDGTRTASGTSMATPHVAGAAAIVLAAHPGYLPAAVSTALVDASTKGILDDARSAKDGILYIEQPPVTAPSGLVATSNDDATINLRWDPVAEPNVHYIVSSRDVTAGETEFVAWTDPVFGATTAVAKDLMVGHRYEFVVAAANTAGTGPPSNIAAATAAFAPPPKPTGLTATAQTDGTIKLGWASLGAVYYWVYQRDVTLGETEFTRLEIPVAELTTFTAGFLLHGHEYEFRISASNRGGEGPQSDPARATSNYPEPPPPTGLTATAGDGKVALTWSPSTPDAWYNIYQRDVTAGETEFTQLPLPITECCAMTADFLPNGHLHEFKVTASVQSRESAPSNLARATPQVALPAQVTDLTATAKTDGTIALAWAVEGENLWFDVYQRDVTTGESFRKLEYPVTSCCAFTASLLTHEHTYEFKVAATNAAGAGPQSAAARATARYSPPAAPRNLRGEAAGNATINLDWDPPAPGNYFFWVYYRDVTAGQTAFAKSQVPTDRTEASLGLLVHNHVYEYKVSAQNAGGEGPASTPVQVTAKGGLPAAPSGLSASAGDGQARLTWTASSTSGVQYNVYQRDVTAGQSWQKLPLPVTATSMTAALLTNGHTYEFKVSAANSAGSSGFSNVASAKPMPPLPAAPSGLSASAGDGQVSLSWTKSSTANVYYWIEMRRPGGAWDRLPYPVPTCCAFTVRLLSNGKTYEFRVRANNLSGDSGSSNVASARPMPPFPQPASGLSATAGDGRVALRWTASPTGGVSYLIEMRSRGGAWRQLPYPVGCCSFTAGLLYNGTTYEFRIRATNMTGTAGASNTASARPLPPIPAAPSFIRVSGGENKALVEWGSSSTPYSSYRVYVRNVSLNNGWTRAADLMGTAVILTLRRGDLYQFRVTAYNIAGEGAPSRTEEFRLSYTRAVMACEWGNETKILTILALYGHGVAPESRADITVTKTLYVNYREHVRFTDGMRTGSGAYWEAGRREVARLDIPGFRPRYDLHVSVRGPSGENWGFAQTNC